MKVWLTTLFTYIYMLTHTDMSYIKTDVSTLCLYYKNCMYVTEFLNPYRLL
jgi:hypothetical protein